MKEVIRYEANDGTVFDTEEACIEYEKRRHWENKIYSELRHADSHEIYEWVLENTKGFKHVDIP